MLRREVPFVNETRGLAGDEDIESAAERADVARSSPQGDTLATLIIADGEQEQAGYTSGTLA